MRVGLALHDFVPISFFLLSLSISPFYRQGRSIPNRAASQNKFVAEIEEKWGWNWDGRSACQGLSIVCGAARTTCPWDLYLERLELGMGSNRQSSLEAVQDQPRLQTSMFWCFGKHTTTWHWIIHIHGIGWWLLYVEGEVAWWGISRPRGGLWAPTSQYLGADLSLSFGSLNSSWVLEPVLWDAIMNWEGMSWRPNWGW